MSTADPDGRMLQALQDRHACLLMEFAEFAREVRADMEERYGPLPLVASQVCSSCLRRYFGTVGPCPDCGGAPA